MENPLTSDQWTSHTVLSCLHPPLLRWELSRMSNRLWEPPTGGVCSFSGSPWFSFAWDIPAFLHLSRIGVFGGLHHSTWVRTYGNIRSSWSVSEVVLLQVYVSGKCVLSFICHVFPKKQVIAVCVFLMLVLMSVGRWHNNVKLNIVQGFKENQSSLAQQVITNFSVKPPSFSKWFVEGGVDV